jgi:hypothetical protein
VVALDRHGLFALGAAGLNHVGVDGALGKEAGALDGRSAVNARSLPSPARLELGRLGLEHVHEQATNDLALGLRLAHARQLAQEQVAGVHANHLRVQLAGKHLHHHVALVQAQEAVVDEHARELIANRAVNQGRGHR